jgi:hypothetical protein
MARGLFQTGQLLFISRSRMFPNAVLSPCSSTDRARGFYPLGCRFKSCQGYMKILYPSIHPTKLFTVTCSKCSVTIIFGDDVIIEYDSEELSSIYHYSHLVAEKKIQES